MTHPLRRALAFLPAVLCMIMIFCFSSENATESADTSGTVIRQVLTVLSPSFNEASPAEQQSVIESMQFIVRKGAHFSVYMLLGALWMLPISICVGKSRLRPLLAWLLAALYAACDEFHQYFVPGRSCEVRDVMIDSSGALLGVLIVTGILYLIARKKTNGSH